MKHWRFTTLFSHPLAKELTLVTAVKIAFLALAAIFLFNADHHIRVDPSTISYRMFDQTFPLTTR
jgi:hypothetical protein